MKAPDNFGTGCNPLPIHVHHASDPYSAAYTIENAVDSQSSQTYWSSQLIVNPYAVDDTHDGAVVIDFSINKTVSSTFDDFADATTKYHEVQCVRVISDSQDKQAAIRKKKEYYPVHQVLYRASNGSDKKALKGGIHNLEGWTQMWELTITTCAERPACSNPSHRRGKPQWCTGSRPHSTSIDNGV